MASSHTRSGLAVAVTSGKGGVGKTSITVNLALALAALGHTVGVLDADFGLGNLDVMLGLTPGAHVGDVLAGDKSWREVVVPGPSGIQIIPAGSGIRGLTALSPSHWSRIADVIVSASAAFDFLLIDTAPGIGDNVLELVRLADRVLVVTSFEPTAVVDAYAMTKLLVTADRTRDLGIVVNTARTQSDAQAVFRQLDAAARRFLKRDLKYCGCIVHDQHVADAVIAQRPVLTTKPASPASLGFRRLAMNVASWRPDGPIARAEFERMEAPRCA
jgi:flagellar biosynthesis protein FlhG